ncbi:hypothetical protein L1049_023662 [Liquidambar formosana]|uniref:Zinc finger MYM-type protein 1-like n=1 Tax=Liquidambar formosana TaxID=63359 RepID=A0AAP0RUU0_LIQFO
MSNLLLNLKESLLLNFKESNLMILLFNGNQGSAFRFVNIPLINEMRLDERISKQGHINLFIKRGAQSPHNDAVEYVNGLKNVTWHIDKVINAQTTEEIQKNRGHDEYEDSKNRGNFIELIKFMAKLRVDIDDVVLEKAPKNAKYTSLMIQKEILHIFANKMRNKIRDEVKDAKFSILVDEAKDESNREQMAIVLRFVDVDGFLREPFFEIVHISDTTAATLKQEISNVLFRFNLQIQNMRGQGYDGASNMHALVAAAQDEISIWEFLSKLTCIVNLVSVSPKCHQELQSAQAIEIANMVATGERETGRAANQMGSLHRAGATHWSSHYDSICSLIDMYSATCIVLSSLVVEGSSQTIRGQAGGALKAMKSFEFLFILHLMNKIMKITDLLCKALQHKSVDILNAMEKVLNTKALLQTLRKQGWDNLIMFMASICTENGIDIPDMDARYKGVRSCKEKDHISIKHYYHIDIFNATIDRQLMELNSRFNEGAVELLTLSMALEPRNSFKSFKIDDICRLASKFYPDDFTNQDMHHLRSQLQHYEIDVPHHHKFHNMSTISELCRGLIETEKQEDYYLIDRLICLVLTLPVSTATTKRAFSAMKLVKFAIRNKMGDEFLADSMVLYIEKEIAENIDLDSIIDDFYFMKNRRTKLQ